MAFYRGPRIITDGLSVYFDAKNIKSYSGSGNNWYDLINRNRYVSSGTYLPLYTTLGGVTCFNFNQVGSSFSNSSFFTSGFPSTSGSGSELTIDVWIYLNASELQADDRANIIQGASAWYESINKTSLKLSNYWYGKTNEGYHETTSSLSRGTWYNLVSVWTQSELYQFVNTIKIIHKQMVIP